MSEQHSSAGVEPGHRSDAVNDGARARIAGLTHRANTLKDLAQECRAEASYLDREAESCLERARAIEAAR